MDYRLVVPGPLLGAAGLVAPGLWAALGRVFGELPGVSSCLSGWDSCQASHRPFSAPQPGDMKRDPLNNCTFFSCMKIHGQFISSVSSITCPDFDPSTCLPVSGPITAGSAGPRCS